jgi:hypothetical protein
MALAIDRRSAATGFSGTTITISSFILAQTSPLIVAVVVGATQAVSGVTWNGSENLTALGSVTSGGNAIKTWLFGLKNPTPTTADIVATFASAPLSGAAVYAISTTGGDTITGWRSVFTRNDGNGTGPGLTVTDAQNGDLVFHAAGCYGSATITFDGSEDTTGTKHNNLFGNNYSTGLSTLAATGSTAVGCTDVSVYAEAAIAVIPAAGGGPPATQNLFYRRRR